MHTECVEVCYISKAWPASHAPNIKSVASFLFSFTFVIQNYIHYPSTHSISWEHIIVQRRMWYRRRLDRRNFSLVLCLQIPCKLTLQMQRFSSIFPTVSRLSLPSLTTRFQVHILMLLRDNYRLTYDWILAKRLRSLSWKGSSRKATTATSI